MSRSFMHTPGDDDSFPSIRKLAACLEPATASTANRLEMLEGRECWGAFNPLSSGRLHLLHSGEHKGNTSYSRGLP